MLMRDRFAICLLLLAVTQSSMADVIGRWSGAFDFPGWPQIYGVFTADDEGGSLSIFQANLLDEPVESLRVDGDALAFDVSIHGSDFAFKGSSGIVGGDSRLTGSIMSGDSDVEGRFDLIRTPIVSGLPGARRWSGTLDIQGIQQLDMILDLARDDSDKLHVDISIPKQKVVRYPLEITSDDEATVIATLHTGLPATMTMALGEERIEVAFKQGSFQQDITFTPDQAAQTTLNRPQEPQPPFPYESREVVVSHPDGHELAGTLTVPEGVGPHPAVVLVSGSGLQDRNQEILGHKPFLVLADHLTRNGIAVLRADDRGVGGSTVEDRSALRNVTSQDFASDIDALVEHLGDQPGIDTARIGLVGHSEGGSIGPMVADQRDDVAFLVLMAGTGRPGLEVLKDQNRRIMEVQQVDDAVIDATLSRYGRVMQLVIDGASDDELREPMRALTSSQIDAMQLDVEVTDNVVDEAIAESRTPWLRFFMVHDPAVVLERIDVPILAINGTLDVQVVGSVELPAIEHAVRRGGGEITVRSYEGLNHLFQPAVTGSVEEYGDIETTIDPQVLTDITEWINARVVSNDE